MADTSTPQVKKRDWDGIIACALFLSIPLTIPMANRGIDALSDHMAQVRHDIIVGQCIDMSPMPQGKAVDLIREGDLVKVLQVDAEGSQSITFIGFSAAQSLMVACKAES